MALETTMASDNSIRAREIFAEAAAMPAAARPAYLDSACAGDGAVRDHVAALLAAHDRAGEFIAGATLDAGRLLAAVAGTAEVPGDQIGPYKLLQLIGEGGFGAVYLAEQEQPVRRKVALKVIKLGMDTKQVIARFEAERQALAMMDHPNIAKVFEAGATASGRPYFVMELVPGVPITTYCDAANLTTRQRLELFVPVCRAVQHAHQKGVIHRDLKPGNVLVKLHDGVPVPKVIDFGIAKATEGRLTDRTLFTEHRQMIGTPEYMSPEQAWTGGLDVDTRSDVYSLGVLLYELLTSTTPFDGKELRGKGFDEIQRIIREVDPQPPSTRLGTLGASLSAVAARRRTEPARLGQLVRGELDWVVLKCLEKDRARRYDSAGSLADDVQRFLRDEIVQARAPSFADVLRKYARRHRVALSAGAAVAVALVAGLCAATAGFVHATRQRDAAVTARAAESLQRAAAERAREQADRARAQAVGVNTLLHQLFVAVNRRRTGNEASLQKALDDAAAKVDSGTLKAQPDVEAAVHSTLGNLYASWGAYPEGERQLRLALDARRRAAPTGGDIDLANSLADLGWLFQQTRRHDEAEPLLRESLELRRRLLGPRHPSVADALHALAIVLLDRNERDEAHALVRQSLAIRIADYDAALAAAPGDARTLSLRAHVRARAGDFRGAVADYSAASASNPADHWSRYHNPPAVPERRRRLPPGLRRNARPICRRRGAGGRRARSQGVCLLDPEYAKAHLAETAPPIERALESQSPLFIGWFQITKGIHEYRGGHWDSAISWLRRGRAGVRATGGKALADFFLAMSFHHVGRHDWARSAFANGARSTPDDPMDLSGMDPLDGGSAIGNWLVARIAKREAQGLLNGAETTGRESSSTHPSTDPAN